MLRMTHMQFLKQWETLTEQACGLLLTLSICFPEGIFCLLKSSIFFNPLALELDIYSLAHHLSKMWIFDEQRRVTLGNTRHFVEE